MDVEHPTATWEALQDGKVFYRRQQVYSIPGKLPHLGDFIIAGCRYGGPIGRRDRLCTSICMLMKTLALMRDTSKVTVLGGASTAFAKAQIQVYSAAGEGLLLFSVVISLLCSASRADR